MKHTIDGITYNVYKNYATVCILADETLTKIHIPDKVEGKPIIRIDVGAFKNTDIIYISLPFSLEKICKEAFCNCKSLTKIEQRGMTSTNIIEVCDMAFYFCTKLNALNLTKRLLLTCNKDGSHFGFCRSLKSLQSVEIESCSDFYFTFQNCESLENIMFSGVYKLEFAPDTFWNCTKLRILVLDCSLQLNNYTRDVLKQVTIITSPTNKKILELGYEGYKVVSDNNM